MWFATTVGLSLRMVSQGSVVTGFTLDSIYQREFRHARLKLKNGIMLQI